MKRLVHSIAVLMVMVSLAFVACSNNGTAASTMRAVIGDTDDGTPRTDKAEVVIKAPDKVKIGDMIVIDLSESIGAGFDYKVIPEPPGLRVFNDGKTIVCGTGDKNVTYLFIVSCALAGDSNIKTHEIKVYGADTGPPLHPGENIVGKVQEWCEDVQSPTKRDDALKLAQSFASVAIIIEQDSFSSASELVQATATSNREALNGNIAHWTPVLNELMQELKAMAETGQLSDVKSHAQVWREVAQGLREYANSL
jgi:hypothetical protein